jgi:histidine ammonia-lyase
VKGHALVLEPGHLSLADLRRIWREPLPLTLAAGAAEKMAASTAAVRRIVARGEVAYGINTGFGRLAKTRIADDQLLRLQRNLILSHSVGIGALLPDPVVRLAIAMKVASLARGYSGVRRELVEAMVALHNAGIVPAVPEQGSVGASGDLAPLAHLTLALIGEGQVRSAGKLMPAVEALRSAGIAPLELQAKEGLALINGTQISTALALHALFTAERLFEAAVVVGALSVDAAKGSDAPFDARLHELRGQPGQIETARTLPCAARRKRNPGFTPDE